MAVFSVPVTIYVGLVCPILPEVRHCLFSTPILPRITEVSWLPLRVMIPLNTSISVQTAGAPAGFVALGHKLAARFTTSRPVWENLTAALEGGCQRRARAARGSVATRAANSPAPLKRSTVCCVSTTSTALCSSGGSLDATCRHHGWTPPKQLPPKETSPPPSSPQQGRHFGASRLRPCFGNGFSQFFQGVPESTRKPKIKRGYPPGVSNPGRIRNLHLFWTYGGMTEQGGWRKFGDATVVDTVFRAMETFSRSQNFLPLELPSRQQRGPPLCNPMLIQACRER